MPEYQFPQFEIGGAQPQPSVLRHAAYNTLPHQAVQPWRRQNIVVWTIVPGGNFFTANQPVYYFTFDTSEEQVAIITGIQHWYLGLPSALVSVGFHDLTPALLPLFLFGLNLTGDGFKYLINGKSAWQVDSFMSDPPETIPAETGTTLVFPYQGSDQISPEGKFNLVVPPKSRFEATYRSTINISYITAGVTSYTNVFCITDVTGKLMPKSLYDQFVAENGGR